jgi:hypothetical protein
VLGIGAVAAPRMTTLVSRDPLAAMEDLDRAGREADIDLLADEGVRDRVEEARRLDVVIEVDTGEAPLGELVRLGR